MANYPTESYTNLTERFKSIAGLQSLETTDASFFRQAINRRFRTAYQRYPWPDFTVIGESVALDTDSANTIQTFDVGNLHGNIHGLLNDADVVFRIHKTDPKSSRYPEEYTYVSLLNAGGKPSVKIISPTVLNSVNVFVTYRKDVESVVKDGSGTTGFYGDASGDTANVPFRFFEYMAFGAYADFLRGDGQTEKAQVEDQNAEMILRQEIDIVRNQSRQFRHDILQYRPQTQFRRHNVQAGGTPLDQNQVMLDNNVQ
jgi:hypothetical protein|tara:strand:- start:1813 stop:2583 length:771 start_codon:yes stop_codon:yes gene_type:complete